METTATFAASKLEVYLTSAGWFIFRDGPLTFPVAGPYDNERDARTVLRYIADHPFRPIPA